MSVYWDTSALLSLSDEIFVKLRESARHVTLSHITELELHCAVARVSSRRKKGGDRLLRAVLAVHRPLEKVHLLRTAEDLFPSARILAARHQLSACDGLHLAAALFVHRHVQEGVELASYDRALREAALGEGIRLFPV